MNSSELRGFLTGLMLGDGFIGNGVSKRSFSIKSIKEDFIHMIDDEIKSCTNFNTYIKFTPEHYSCGCNHKDSWELTVKANQYFMKKYHHFYDDNRHRTVSKDAIKWLTPRGLANWYMSDGYVCLVGKTKGHIRDRRVDICTDRYSLDTVLRLQDMLKKKFDIETSKITHNKSYRIRINKSSYKIFFSTIQEYIVDGMKYKMYLGYDQQPEWMPDDMWNIQLSLSSTTAPDYKEQDIVWGLLGSTRQKNPCLREGRVCSAV